MEHSFNDYVEFIQNNPRYENALNRVSDPEQYVKNIQAGGYATDPDYAEKIISIFRRETLLQLDWKNVGMNIALLYVYESLVLRRFLVLIM